MALLFSLLKIAFIDMVLSGDNAVVIAMAARSLPRDMQRKAIIGGGAAAIILRVVLTALVAYALAIPLLQTGGGILLFWIACKLLKGGDEAKEIKSGSTLREAIGTIVLADFVMSLDNMLAVGGAAHGSLPLLLTGLTISMGIIMFASGLIANLMNRFGWLIYAGAAILGWTAGDMVLNDRWLHRVFVPGPVLEYLVPAGFALAALCYGWMVNRAPAEVQ